MRILIITDSLPYPLLSGDRIRMYHLIRRLERKHEVFLATLLEPDDQLTDIEHMRRYCKEIITARLRPRGALQHLPGLLRYTLLARPPELYFQEARTMQRKLANLCALQSFDIVHVAHSHMALYAADLPRKTCPHRVLEFHNVAFLQYKRLATVPQSWRKRIRPFLHSMIMRSWEPRYAGRFDRCIVVSENDRTLLQTRNHLLKIDVIPNGVDTRQLKLLPEETKNPILVFVGKMSYPACVDAVHYFCHQVLPRVRSVFAGAEFWIVGKDPPPEVRALAGDGVIVTGTVAEVVSYYRRALVSVVPIRAGGGTRLKILEAMALGRPVVATRVGSEGIEAKHEEHIMLADDAQTFADHILRLLADGDLRASLRKSARQLVVEKYDWNVQVNALEGTYRQVLNGG